MRCASYFYNAYFFTRSNVWPPVIIDASRQFLQVVKRKIWWRNNISTSLIEVHFKHLIQALAPYLKPLDLQEQIKKGYGTFCSKTYSSQEDSLHNNDIETFSGTFGPELFAPLYNFLILFFICCRCPSSWGKQQPARTFNTSHSIWEPEVLQDGLAVIPTPLLRWQRNPLSYIWVFCLAAVQSKDHLPSHMQMKRCHKIPVTHLKYHCHQGCDRLFEIAVITYTQWLGILGRWILLNFIRPGRWLHLGRHPPCSAVLHHIYLTHRYGRLMEARTSYSFPYRLDLPTAHKLMDKKFISLIFFNYSKCVVLN